MESLGNRQVFVQLRRLPGCAMVEDRLP
jgi:hypothetical protein